MSKRVGLGVVGVVWIVLGSTGVGVPEARAGCTNVFGDDVAYGTGIEPTSVAIGDLDGDGDADLVVANDESDNVSVLLNNGDGSFADDVLYGAGGNRPIAIAIADLDGDGDADLAVTLFFAEAVAVLLNNGDGTFADAVLYDTGAQSVSMGIGDLDGDGDVDLAVIRGLGVTGVAILLNHGDGTFAEAVLYDPGVSPNSVVVGDLDGDGDADLAVSNDNPFVSGVTVLLNNGDGTFAEGVLYDAGIGPNSMAIGDLDGDGDADLAVTNLLTETVTVLLNNGDGVFPDHVAYGTGVWPLSVAIGDLDGDGDADLVVVNVVDDNVSVLLNNGDGTFADDVLHSAGDGPGSVAIGDLDGDGDADIAVTNFSGDNVSVLPNLCANVHNLTQGTDWFAIQPAIDDAVDGDEIEVDPGTGTFVENIDLLGKDITLRSTDPLDLTVVEATIIDGGGVDTVVFLSAGTLSGFTITGGANTGTNAGGVHATGTAVVSHNVITGNSADQKGGGVTAEDTVIVSNNRIVSNSGGNRAGGVNARDDALVIDNFIAFNDAVSGGGGIRARENCTIRNNTLVFNSSADTGGGVLGGGGILAEDSSILLNNIISFSTDGVGIHAVVGDAVTADYNCVFGNFDDEYSGDAVAGPNDLNVDPELDDDDLHLLFTSPCINAGDPDLIPLADETDIDDNPRILAGRVDIGADEGDDCNGNGILDADDIAAGTSQDCNADGIPDECVGSDDDCNGNGIPDECIDLEDDCNSNGIPDTCDTSAGTSPDCNGNGIPDECIDLENDCNVNDIPDACDISAGTSLDCNLNGIPDQCDLAEGTSQDCTGTGIPDECDLLADGYTVMDSNEPGGPVYDFEAIFDSPFWFTEEDGITPAIPIGFEFRFFDQVYTDVYLADNGFLTFLPGQSGGCCSGEPIPSAGSPNAIIAAWWADLSRKWSGFAFLRYDVLGTSPDRRFIAMYWGIEHFLSSDVTTMEIKLFERDGSIEIHYEDVGLSTIFDAPHSVGVEDQTGSNGVEYFFGTDALTTPLAVRFRSTDCNGNGIPDDCDIAEGISEDTNGNGVLDGAECDLSSVPCGDVQGTLFTCSSASALKLGVHLSDFSHDGETVTLLVDGVAHEIPVVGQRARLFLPGQSPGSHTVELSAPAGCIPPETVICEALFQVIFPEPMQTGSQDFAIVDSKIEITVIFNEDVDMSSLLAGTNVILETEVDANADITIAPGSTGSEIVITSDADFVDLCIFDSDCFFTLRLLGDAVDPVRSVDGEILDGDSDNSPGGDYETSFVIIG